MRRIFLVCLNVTMSDMENNFDNNLITADLKIYPELRQVKIGSTTIHLGPVNMKVMLVLLQNHGQVVSRETMFDLVWKNQIVSDDTLTRCISDLRTKIGKYSQQPLIKTVPKRGYKWLPKVEALTEKEPQHYNSTRPYLYWIMMGVLLVYVLSTSVLWLANSIFRPEYTRLVLMPIQANLKTHQVLAKDIEDILRKKILQTNKVRFLAKSASPNNSNQSFAYLANEFGVKWIVEGRIRQYKDKTRVTLSLVDVRTAMEVYSLTDDNDAQMPQLKKFSYDFINNAERILNL